MHPFRFSLQAFEATSAASWVGTCTRAEALGYDTLFTTDHYFGPGEIAAASGHRPVDVTPISAMTMAAAVTSTIKVGCRVFGVDYHHPVVLAKELATVRLPLRRPARGGDRRRLGAGGVRRHGHRVRPAERAHRAPLRSDRRAARALERRADRTRRHPCARRWLQRGAAAGAVARAADGRRRGTQDPHARCRRPTSSASTSTMPPASWAPPASPAPPPTRRRRRSSGCTTAPATASTSWSWSWAPLHLDHRRSGRCRRGAGRPLRRHGRRPARPSAHADRLRRPDLRHPDRAPRAPRGELHLRRPAPASTSSPRSSSVSPAPDPRQRAAWHRREQVGEAHPVVGRVHAVVNAVSITTSLNPAAFAATTACCIT